MANLTLATYENGVFQGGFSPAASATIYLAGTNTLATVYADETGTAMTNPLPTGVTVGSNGIDTAGNIRFAATPAKYEIGLPGSIRVRADIAVDPADIGTHFDDPNGHGVKAYVDANFLSASDLGAPGGAAVLDTNGVMVTGQVLMSVPAS